MGRDGAWGTWYGASLLLCWQLNLDKADYVAAVVPGKAELSHEVVPLQSHSSESSKTYVMVCLFLKDMCSRNY